MLGIQVSKGRCNKMAEGLPSLKRMGGVAQIRSLPCFCGFRMSFAAPADPFLALAVLRTCSLGGEFWGLEPVFFQSGNWRAYLLPGHLAKVTPYGGLL